MTAQRNLRYMDEDGFLSAVRIRLDQGGTDFPGAVGAATARRRLDPAFESGALARGLTEIARDHLGTGVRDSAIRAVRVSRSQARAAVGRTLTVSVSPSPLRGWLVHTPEGQKRLEISTPDEVLVQAEHHTKTINGLIKHRAVSLAVAEAGIAAGVSVLGELSDEVLNECLAAGEGS